MGERALFDLALTGREYGALAVLAGGSPRAQLRFLADDPDVLPGLKTSVAEVFTRLAH